MFHIIQVAGKSYFGSANTKKAAKTAVATEAWNVLRKLLKNWLHDYLKGPKLEFTLF